MTNIFRKNKTGIERCRKQKKLPALDKYLVFAFSCILVFTTAMVAVQAVTGMTQDTLITCFYGCFGGELLLCAMIKRLKLKKGDSDNDI